MEVRWTDRALSDLDHIIDYLNERSPQAAHRVAVRIKFLVGRLADFPQMGQVVEAPSLRRLVVSPFPYLIFYDAHPDVVIVHALRHAARNPETWPKLN